MLSEIAKNVWSASETKKMLPGVYIPVKSLIVRLQSGDVVLISPIPGIAAFAAEINALGPVKAIVAPNLFHHLGVPPAVASFANARVFAAPALQAKRTDLRFTDTLGPTTETLWANELVQVFIEGLSSEETVFFHTESATLYVSDLLFNMKRPDQFFGRFMLNRIGPYGVVCFPKAMKRRITDARALRASLDRIVALSPTRLVPCHGEVVTTDVTATLKEAFSFLRPE